MTRLDKLTFVTGALLCGVATAESYQLPRSVTSGGAVATSGGSFVLRG